MHKIIMVASVTQSNRNRDYVVLTIKIVLQLLNMTRNRKGDQLRHRLDSMTLQWLTTEQGSPDKMVMQKITMKVVETEIA